MPCSTLITDALLAYNWTFPPYTGNPKPGCLQVVCKLYAGALFCTPILWAFLHSFAPFCIRQRLGRPCLGAAYHSWASLLTDVFGGFCLHLKFLFTVRAKNITESILERVGPAIFKTFLLKLITFRPIPVISPARRAKLDNYLKRQLTPDRAHPQ